jgi:hypothetical protein
MRIPVWLTLGVAAIVLVFGSYRLYLAFHKKGEGEDDLKKRSGLYRMSPRAHLAVGVIYILLGIGLVAASFGWNPFGKSIGPDTETPTKDTKPAKDGTIPIDGVTKPGKG